MLAVIILHERELPYAAWQLLTKIQNLSEREVDRDVNNDFSGLDKILGFEQWVSQDNKNVVDNASHPMIRTALVRSLTFLGMNRIEIDVDFDRFRIIDVDSCNSLLEQTQLESETQDWLEA